MNPKTHASELGKGCGTQTLQLQLWLLRTWHGHLHWALEVACVLVPHGAAARGKTSTKMGNSFESVWFWFFQMSCVCATDLQIVIIHLCTSSKLKNSAVCDYFANDRAVCILKTRRQESVSTWRVWSSEVIKKGKSNLSWKPGLLLASMLMFTF